MKIQDKASTGCKITLDVRAGPQWNRGPKPYVPSYLRSIHAISIVESMEIVTYHSTWGPNFQALSPKYDIDVYMATLFGGEFWDLC